MSVGLGTVNLLSFSAEIIIMFKLLAALFVAVGCVQAINCLFIRYIQGDGLIEYLRVVLLTMPIQVIVSLAVSYYYTSGMKLEIPYFMLSMISVSVTLTASALFTVFVYWHRAMSGVELAACLVTFSGICLSIYAKAVSQ